MTGVQTCALPISQIDSGLPAVEPEPSRVGAPTEVPERGGQEGGTEGTTSAAVIGKVAGGRDLTGETT